MIPAPHLAAERSRAACSAEFTSMPHALLDPDSGPLEDRRMTESLSSQAMCSTRTAKGALEDERRAPAAESSRERSSLEHSWSAQQLRLIVDEMMD
jgi:hypothetical protein